MAYEMAGELNVDPFTALLGEVRRTAWRVGLLDDELMQAEDVQDLVGNGRLVAVDKLQFRERTHLARVSKMAIDAGIAERLVAQIEADGQAIAGVYRRAVDRVPELPDELREALMGALRSELLALDAGTIEGEAEDV